MRVLVLDGDNLFLTITNLTIQSHSPSVSEPRQTSLKCLGEGDGDITVIHEEERHHGNNVQFRPQKSVDFDLHEERNGYARLKEVKNDEMKKWNVFEETGTNDQSVSERKYDKNLLKKYKILRVHT